MPTDPPSGLRHWRSIQCSQLTPAPPPSTALLLFNCQDDKFICVHSDRVTFLVTDNTVQCL